MCVQYEKDEASSGGGVRKGRLWACCGLVVCLAYVYPMELAGPTITLESTSCMLCRSKLHGHIFRSEQRKQL
jgi:hypothetical protein